MLCLRSCEEAWEQAYTRCSELSLALIAARRARQFSRTSGHQILAASSKACALAGEGQSELASLHRLMERFAQINGIEVKMDGDDYGDGRKTPDDVFGGA